MTTRTLAIGFALLLSLCGGCVTADLGAPYEHDLHSVTPRGQSKAIFYVDGAVHPAIYYYVYIDGEKVGHLFPGTFTEVDVDPGQYRVTATEWFTGKGAGEGFKESLFSKKIFSSEVDIGAPPELKAGERTTLELTVAAGDVAYVRITKPAEAVEYFYECEATTNTTTMCQGTGYPTEVRRVAVDDARKDLETSRESL